MEFHLAERLSKTHAQLMHELSDHELYEWQALFEVESEERSARIAQENQERRRR